MPAFIDLTGRKFGRLTVLGRGPDTHYKHPRWFCRCDCGTERLVHGQGLRSGTSQSCGCLNRERVAEADRKKNFRHGHSVRGNRSLTWLRWNAMKSRCERPGDSSFRKYGAKGVRVCDRWQDYSAFLADMGECPSQKHGIDRLDNSRGYEPGNCRWATQKEQQNNRTNNRLITALGETLTLAQWTERLGVCRETIGRRLKTGWPVDRAVSEPPRSKWPKSPVIR